MKKILDFNDLIFQGQHEILPEDIKKVLNSLAYGLEHYEENPEFRAQDPSFFDDD